MGYNRPCMAEIKTVLGCAFSAALPFVGGGVGIAIDPSPDGFGRGFVAGAGLGIAIQTLGRLRPHKKEVSTQINRIGHYAIEQAKKKDLKTDGLNHRIAELVVWYGNLEVQKTEEEKKRNQIEQSYITQAKTAARNTGKPKEETNWKRYFDKPGFERVAGKHIRKIQELSQEIDGITGAMKDVEREIKAIEEKYNELLELASLRAALTVRGGDIPPEEIRKQLRTVGIRIRAIEDFFSNP